jgi:2-hydroxychromene-2-carboxylate isomerase
VAPQRDPASDAAKAELRARTEAAVALGLFGVPTLVADGRHFFGLDALPMLRAALAGEPWFDGPAWDSGGNQPPGLQRR